jgi:hypothetical protein
MATYLPGVTDTYPQFQPFTPNFDFYNQALQIKHAQYQQGYKKLSGLYNTLLNSPMTRDENLERRDKYFKDIEGEIKKISGLDLSLPQNVSAAGEIFKPFYEDQDIKNDMYVTKTARDSMTAHEILKNCVGKDCGEAKAWNEGIKAVNYRLQEFKNASTEEARSFGKIGYTPYVRYADDVVKFLKDNKIEITQETRNGRYNITTTNGPLLEGPLYNMIKTLYEDDINIQDMYKTKAYVERKDFSFGRAQEFGGVEQAEQAYISEKFQNISGVIDTQLDQINDQLALYNGQRNGLIKKAKLNTTDQESLRQLEMAIPLLEKSAKSLETAKSNYENLDQVDINTLRSRVDNISSGILFENDIKGMAKDFSKIGFKQTFEKDDYTFAAYTSSLDFNKQVALAKIKDQLDLDSFKNKEIFKYNLELEKEIKLRGGKDPLTIIPGKSNSEKVDAFEYNVKTVNEVNQNLTGTLKNELNNIYLSLKNDKSPEAQALLKQIFGKGDDQNYMGYDEWNGYPAHLAVWDKAKSLLAKHTNYKNLIKSDSEGEIAKQRLMAQSSLKLARENNLKVKNALVTSDSYNDNEKSDIRTLINANGDVISKNQFIAQTKNKYDAEDAGEVYDELIEDYKTQYANPEAPEGLRTKMFIGGPFEDRTGGIGVKPGIISADPLRNLSDNFSVVNSVLTNGMNSGEFESEDDKSLFMELYRDFNTNLDSKKENKDRASLSMTYEAVSDKEGYAKVTINPSMEWLKKSLMGADKTEESSKVNKYKNGLSYYIENDKVQNSFDSQIKGFGDLIFEANGGNVNIGDNDDPKNGGYVSVTKNGNNYTVSSRTVNVDRNTGDAYFNPISTTTASGIDTEKLIDEAVKRVYGNKENISKMLELIDIKNQELLNKETR